MPASRDCVWTACQLFVLETRACLLAPCNKQACTFSLRPKSRALYSKLHCLLQRKRECARSACAEGPGLPGIVKSQGFES
jgi:hypothetical protein